MQQLMIQCAMRSERTTQFVSVFSASVLGQKSLK